MHNIMNNRRKEKIYYGVFFNAPTIFDGNGSVLWIEKCKARGINGKPMTLDDKTIEHYERMLFDTKEQAVTHYNMIKDLKVKAMKEQIDLKDNEIKALKRSIQSIPKYTKLLTIKGE